MKETKLTWKGFEKLTDILCEKIKEKKNEYKWIIGLARGGLIPSTTLSHKLGVNLGVFSISSYNGKEKVKFQKDLYVSMIGQFKPNEKVLIIDDIADSGESLSETVKSIKKIDPDVKQIDTAVLYYKPKSIITPTYYSKKIKNDDWIIFPWEHSDKQLR